VSVSYPGVRLWAHFVQSRQFLMVYCEDWEIGEIWYTDYLKNVY